MDATYNPELDHMRRMAKAIALMRELLMQANISNVRPDTVSHLLDLARAVKEEGGWDRFLAWCEQAAKDNRYKL